MTIHDFFMSVFNYPYKSGYLHWYPSRDIHEGHSAMDIRYQWMDIHVFMDISLELCTFLWISIWMSLDFHGYPCINLLRILNSGRWKCKGEHKMVHVNQRELVFENFYGVEQFSPPKKYSNNREIDVQYLESNKEVSDLSLLNQPIPSCRRLRVRQFPRVSIRIRSQVDYPVGHFPCQTRLAPLVFHPVIGKYVFVVLIISSMTSIYRF